MTGYGVKYYIVDKKIVTTTEVVYTFEILEQGYSGSSTQWDGISIKRNYEESDFRNINLLQKSSCSASISVLDQSNRNEITAIAESEIGDYAVRLKRDSDIVWTGLVVPDLTTITEENYGNQTANISAKDILLRGDYSLTTGSEKAIVIIADILETLGYEIDIVSFTSWEANGLDDTDDILEQVYHEKERFRIYGQTDDEEDQPISLETALSYMLKTYGMILRQAEGTWILCQISAFGTAIFSRRFVYDKDGTQTSKSLIYSLGSTLVQSSNGELQIKGSSTNNYFGGIKVIRGEFDHKSVFQGMKFNREYWFDLGDPDYVNEQYWQADGTGNLSLEFNLWYANSGGLGIPPLGNTNVFDVQIWVETGTGTNYYFDGENWTTTLSVMNINVPENPQTTDGDGNDVYKVFFDVITDPIPALADGQLKVEFQPNAGVNDVYWYVRDVVFNLEYSDEIEGSSSAIKYSLTQTGDYSIDYDYGSWPFGQGPTSASLSALKKSDNTLLSQFRRDLATGYTNHQELLLSEILDISRNARRNLRAQLYGEYEPDKNLTYVNDGNQKFFFLGGSWDSKSYTWTVNAIELNVETANDDDLDTIYITNGAGTTGGNAVGSSSATSGAGGDNLLKANNLSDVASASTSRTNLGLGTGNTVEFDTANIGINTNTPNSVAIGSSIVGYNNGLRFASHMATNSNSGRTMVAFSNLNGLVGYISTSGTATTYSTSSDYRLKENVEAMTGALERVMQLNPSRFNFVADSQTIVDGFLAHEVSEIVPEAITGSKDEVDDDGNPVYQGIDQSKLVPLLVGAIQDLKDEIEELKARLS